MALDRTQSLPPVVLSRSAPKDEAKAPDATTREGAHMAVELHQIEAEEKVIFQTINRVDQLTQELKAVIQKLAGDLSNYSRAEVEEMAQRAFILEQELETLKTPEQARADGPGL